MRPTLATALLVGLAVLPLAAPHAASAAPEKTSPPQPHPRFDDGGTLDWRSTWAEASDLARERRQLVFIEWGRES